MKRKSEDQSEEEVINSKLPSSQELELDTQSYVSKEELISPKFKPFKNERGSTGKLIKRTNPQSQPLLNQPRHFDFLQYQEARVKEGTSNRLQHSTTHLLGLNQRAITAEGQPALAKTRLKHFKLNLTADQGFIKQFREIEKQIKPITTMNCAFLTTNRDYFYKINQTPGPGVYNSPSRLNQNGVDFARSPQMSKQRSPVCQQDFYDVGKIKKSNLVPDFERVIGRDEAYQNSIFAQIEYEKRQQIGIKREEEFDEKKVDRELEYLRQYQQKYGKGFNYQKHNDLALKTKIQQPEVMHTQWGKMLDRYGFKKQRGKLIKQKNPSTQHY